MNSQDALMNQIHRDPRCAKAIEFCSEFYYPNYYSGYRGEPFELCGDNVIDALRLLAYQDGKIAAGRADENKVYTIFIGFGHRNIKLRAEFSCPEDAQTIAALAGKGFGGCDWISILPPPPAVENRPPLRIVK